MRLPVLIFLFLTLFLFKPASTHADSGFLGRIGDSVQPMEHTQVEMVKKEINAEVTERYTYFEAVFTFHNDGPETTVLMGFPEASSQENGPPEEQPQGRFHQDLENFKTYLDGEKVAVEKEAGLLQEEGISNVYFPNWYTWEIDFSEGQTREVKNTYKAPNSMEGGFITSTGYIKSTGSTWQGSIGEARIKFILKDLSPHQLIFAVPPGFQIKDGNLVWEWEDFEPRHNIEMSFLSHLTGQSREFHLPEKIIETWDSWDEKLASGNYSEVLKEAEKILQETGPDENDDEKVKLHYLAKAYRSLAKENLGHSERAIANWESLLADIGAPETMMEPLKDYVYKKTCYHLAGLYHDTGRDPQLEELYNKLLESPPNAPLKRIVESFLPPEKIKRAEPVISEFSIQQDGKLHLRAEDSDGDLAEVIFTLWEEQNGAKNIISEQQLPTYNAYYTYFYHDMTPGMEMNLQHYMSGAGSFTSMKFFLKLKI